MGGNRWISQHRFEQPILTQVDAIEQISFSYI